MGRKEEFVSWLHEADAKAKKLGISSPRFVGMLNAVDKGERDVIDMALHLIWSKEPKQGFLRAKRTDKRVSLEWGVSHEFPDLFDQRTVDRTLELLKD